MLVLPGKKKHVLLGGTSFLNGHIYYIYICSFKFHD